MESPLSTYHCATIPATSTVASHLGIPTHVHTYVCTYAHPIRTIHLLSLHTAPGLRTGLANLALAAVIPGLHWLLAYVARVEEPIRALRVQRHQHGQGGVLGAPQRGELPVLLPSQGQEGVPALHQIAGEERVRVTRVVSWDQAGIVQLDHKEHLHTRQVHACT